MVVRWGSPRKICVLTLNMLWSICTLYFEKQAVRSLIKVLFICIFFKEK